MRRKTRLKPEEHAKLSDAEKTDYVKSEDGMFLLDVEEVDGFRIDNTEALRKAVGAERKRADDAEQKLKDSLKQFEGINLDEARDALKRVKAIDAGETDDKTKAKLESYARQLSEKHEAEKAPLKAALADNERLIDELTIDRTLADELGKVTLIEGGRELIEAHIKQHKLVRRVKTAEGKPDLRVFGHDGIEMVTREAGKSGNATVTELVQSVLKTKFPGAYVVTKSSGSGGGGGGSQQSSGNENTDNLSSAQLIANARKSRAPAV